MRRLSRPLEPAGYPRPTRSEFNQYDEIVKMINIFKVALSGIRKAIESAQGLAIEADSLSTVQRGK